ncbi:MAG: dienelactone hydrolase family protein [Acidiferrobacteraceae bacterium]
MAQQSGGLDLGDGVRGFWAAPEGTGVLPAVIVFMEAFGLDQSVEDLCQRLADLGYFALAPDLYHGERFTREQTEQAIARLRRLRDDEAMVDTTRALAALKAHPRVDESRLAVFGVCMGGRLAFLANSIHAAQLQGAVCCYGGGIAPVEDRLGRIPLLDRIGAMRAPLLLLYGAEDTSIAPDEHARIVSALSAARHRYTLSVFPGVGHGFLNAYRPGYRADVAEAAWRSASVFLGEVLHAR